MPKSREVLGVFLIFLLTITAYSQTQPAGQVSRKVTPQASKSISIAPPPVTCPTSIEPKITSINPDLTPPKIESIQATALTKAAKNASADANTLVLSAGTIITAGQDSDGTTKGMAIIAEQSLYADLVNDWTNQADDCYKKAQGLTYSTDTAQSISVAARNAVYASNQAKLAFALLVSKIPCAITGKDPNGGNIFAYAWLAPLWRKGCKSEAVLYYFQAKKEATFANQAQYLYNAEQSTNQVSADLMTATFSLGFQAVLAGTATAGSSQPASTSGSAVATNTQTDAVSTAVSKLEQGGDFNLRFPMPIIYKTWTYSRIVSTFTPNVGTTINGASGQPTITESTYNSLNVPGEVYAEFGSIPTPTQTPAIFFGDVKYGMEWISGDLATKIGTGKIFGIGVASGGIEFASSVRLGMQYFFGPHQAYCVPATTGPCTPMTGGIGGFHFVVSFTPPATTKASATSPSN